MEVIITIVGFLGSGKTTLLKSLTSTYVDKGWNPYLILNDYENANLDAQHFIGQLDSKQIQALSGSCICCSGINELRDFVNRIPEREKGITLIEANGTSDASSLMSFLGVGLNERFLPPVQVSVVDVKNWQQRGEFNELETNQIQVSSLLVLTHVDSVSKARLDLVLEDIKKYNSLAQVIEFKDINAALLPKLTPSANNPKKLDHLKSHWSSGSCDLPNLPNKKSIYDICNAIPNSILRLKGCVQIINEKGFTYFERTPDGKIHVRPFNGVPVTGAKLLAIGPGSDPEALKNAVSTVVQW